MDKALLIINPISGGKLKGDVARKVMQRLRHRGIYVDVKYTRYGGHASEIASQASTEDYSLVIVAGGDGTVNETAAALRGSGMPMAIIPCGSGNGLARHIGLAPDIDKALDVIEKEHIINCDCGEVNGKPFFCTFGMGFDAAVSHKFAASKHRGPINYVRSAVKEFFSYEPASYRLTINGETFEFKAFLITVANASQYGNNAFIAPYASIKDGLLDITIFHDGNPLQLATAGVELFSGRLERNVIVQQFSVAEATIETETKVAHIDGEPIDMETPVEVKCCPGVLRLYTAPEKKPFRPILSPIRYLFRDAGLGIKRIFKRPQ